MKECRLAVIGCAGLPYEMLYDSVKRLPVRLVAACDNNDDLNAFTRHYRCEKSYQDWKQLLQEEKPDFVFAFSQQEPLFEVCREALKTGAYVLAERPIAQNTAQAEELVHLQRDTGKYAMARFNRRFAPAYRMAQEVIGREEFGTPNMFLAKFQAPLYESNRIYLWNHISHILDTAVMLMGDLEITHVDHKIWREHQYSYQINFRTSEGCLGIIQSGSGQCYEYPMERVEIAGDGCNVVVDNIRHLEYNRTTPDRKNAGFYPLGRTGDTIVWNQNYGQMTSFGFYGLEGCAGEIIRAALEKRKPLYQMEDTARVVRLLETIERIVGENEPLDNIDAGLL